MKSKKQKQAEALIRKEQSLKRLYEELKDRRQALLNYAHDDLLKNCISEHIDLIEKDIEAVKKDLHRSSLALCK